MRYAYQNSGHPILKWGMAAPSQTRAPRASLGSLDTPTLVLPKPGAPEPINGCGGLGSTRSPRVMESDGGFKHPMAVGTVMTSDGYFKDLSGCKCSGSGLSGIADTVAAMSLPAKLAAVAGAYLLYKHFKKK